MRLLLVLIFVICSQLFRFESFEDNSVGVLYRNQTIASICLGEICR